MKKISFKSAHRSATSQSTNNAQPLHGKANIIVRPTVDDRPGSCFEPNFDRTLDSYRVRLQEDRRQGLVECSHNQFDMAQKLVPVFYLQEKYRDPFRHDTYQWNGKLLYSMPDADHVRDVLAEIGDELPISLAFEEADTHFYFILIETYSEDLSVDNFLRQQKIWDVLLKEHFCNTRHYSLGYYVRALPEQYYDIIDRDALFGDGDVMSKEDKEFFDDDLSDRHRSCKLMSFSELLHAFVDKFVPAPIAI